MWRSINWLKAPENYEVEQAELGFRHCTTSDWINPKDRIDFVISSLSTKAF